ncbi:SusC/RagA family TonB-linked outer membrane protein [Segetibacter aerophilus]|uniref:SusC/RagA family TonB-linked outer membrane protein n=2 Tax=Segetibacter aerophilus TaxID=670293 RepID=A0A512B878_9BACT|nr:SusC/RagA family TonB-linked outer membrane protein [Segetibacter aerophilus]
MARQAPVTGTVTGAGGTPVNAASVTVKGTSRGTSTNAAGKFTITVAPSDTLVVTAVGFQNLEVPVGTQTDLTVSLAASNRELEQVIVVGYGTQRRRDLTGSVASVSGSELSRQPVLTATQAVQGKVAGVQVISSGDPNALPVIRIRGTGTMLAGANPLYVVDGVISDDIRNINSADITSMDILKDASATAIYGMRAANGVILITTKRGRAGKMVVSYDATLGVKEATKLVNMAGAKQYAGYVNEASVYYGSGDSIVTAATLASGGNTDWYNEILKKGFFQNHNVSVAGGSDKVNYFLSAGYLSDEGIIRTNDFKRLTIRNNNDYKITNNFKISTLLSYSRSTVRNVDLGAFNVAYRAAPYVIAKQNGKYGNTSLSNNVGNPILDQDKNDNSGKGDRFQGNVVGEYKPITWLTLRSSFGVDKNNFRSISYGYKYANVGPDNVFLTSGSNQLRDKSSLTVTESEGNRWVWDNTATAAKRFGDHNLTLLAGITAEDIRTRSIGGSRVDVPQDKDQWYLNAGSTIGARNFNDGDRSTRNSYLSRLNYNYKDKYFLTGTIRADASSRLPANNRWGYFPSVGAGWVLSNEGFMGDQKTFNNLKLRASYGKVGNDGIPSNLFVPLATVNLPYFFNGQEVLNLRLEELADPSLKWEVTREVNVGLDFSLIKNRLSGTVDFYDRKTSDALVRINIPAILGDPNNEYITNAATFTNKGVEVALNWQDRIGSDWRYNLGVNLAYNRNRIEKLNGGQALSSGSVGGQGFTTKSDNGQPIGSFFLWEVEGIFQTEAEVASSAQPGAKPGDLRYRDINKDKVINADDRVYQGSYQPNITYGINGGLSFKALDLSFGGYGTGGGKIYNGKKAARGDFRDNIETSVVNNRWTPGNTNTNVPRANLNELPASTYFLEKGDFFRINNLTVGYTLPRRLLDKFSMQSLRVFATAQNLATFTSYSGFTPEINNGGTLDGGIELAIYPTTRTFAFGVNVGF